ncbi:NAD(P)-dependent oxidoreductase [Paenibacillus methanolicus]|uniref:3-hydroxyisobutyrate dehydrogenase-like beta-hydroxyacid dehydrogenase n=1 Tax=Paenibacillus methanolicus TaxID=582686 RepID=A0A5S5C189_9BACL|nr:NAD(P)-binding domain-containing protein [Paenibacillus methanolicus]TYP73057.1 3-hydroxyisobutyrate dehydrogenase-like beta-hydroxyacid dehydrogenase [Paenibacillus methanolicus]
MSDVSVIGLGPMGAALARTLLQKGLRITVWNRTSEKVNPLVAEGAAFAPQIADAVSASPIVIVCVANYEISHSLLGTAEAAAALAGRVLVQLSTGTPQDARNSETWAREQGAEYLDGAIMATPAQIGMPDTPIFISGVEAAFRRSEPILTILAGNLMYMGESVGAASAWDLAALSAMFGAMFGFFHGARIMEAEGHPVEAFGSLIADISPVFGQMIKYEGTVIQTGSYDHAQSTVKTCMGTAELWLKHAREAGINSEFPTFAMGLYTKAKAAGYENEELAAIMKVLR